MKRAPDNITHFEARRRLLFISYAFPPTGGGGVQRAAKFAKYLPAHGWQPTILTADNPSVPVQDADLAEELDPHMSIVRARTWEPSYAVKQQLNSAGPPQTNRLRHWVRRLCMHFLQPDPQVLWNPAAMRAASTILHRQPHHAILVSGPPFSSFLLAGKLKQRFGIPLVLDFRDEWLLACRYLENYQHAGATYRRQQALMLKSLASADAVIATTQASAAALAEHCRRAQLSTPVSCIYNGYDPDDMALLTTGLIPQAVNRQARQCCLPSGDVVRVGVAAESLVADRHRSSLGTAAPKLKIVYTGTLWTLTDISPLVSAVHALEQNAPHLAATVELILVGRRTPQQRAVLAQLASSRVNVACHDYLPHKQALQMAATADLLLLLLADQSGAERVVPAKMFEYLALDRPILAICPPGESSEILRGQTSVHLFQPMEVTRLAAWLQTILEARLQGDDLPFASAEAATPGLLQFSRPNLTAELAAILTKVAPPR